jgi:DNA-binding CsgD family transcriptional regulator
VSPILPRPIDPTEHEIAVLVAYLAEGGTVGAARSLGISANTVRGHLANIRAKVGATSTAHAVYLLRDRLP